MPHLWHFFSYLDSLSTRIKNEQNMPELPEVETTLLGIKPHILYQTIKSCVIRQPQLRWPIPTDKLVRLNGYRIDSIERRGKYLILTIHDGAILIHLGMSGCLQIVSEDQAINKHDHVDIQFTNHVILRYTDPRRFGAILWAANDPYQHPLIAKLGLEPFAPQFTGEYLHKQAVMRKCPVKSLIMDNKTVVGVGNIYATEALFGAKIHPTTPANKLSLQHMNVLVEQIKAILQRAITQGGTTLKDFLNSDGKPGYFIQQLQVYGRAGLPCLHCRTPIRSMRIGQRTTCFCINCQHDLT